MFIGHQKKEEIGKEKLFLLIFSVDPPGLCGRVCFGGAVCIYVCCVSYLNILFWQCKSFASLPGSGRRAARKAFAPFL